MLSKLTLIGMHNYSNGAIWDDIMLPEGIEKEILINEILKQNGEFSLIYPDMDFLTAQINFFFRKWYSCFEKWIDVLQEEYEPLFNVDVRTTFHEEGNNEDNSETNGLNRDTRNSSGNGASNSSLDKSKAAFDSSTYQPTEREISSLSTSENSSEVGSATNSESMTANSEHVIDNEEYKRGNQGITMSQEMLLAELNVRLFNLYDQIADIFASEFCVTYYV